MFISAYTFVGWRAFEFSNCKYMRRNNISPNLTKTSLVMLLRVISLELAVGYPSCMNLTRTRADKRDTKK